MTKHVKHVRIIEIKAGCGLFVIELTDTNAGVVLKRMLLEPWQSVDPDAKVGLIRNMARKDGIEFDRYRLEFV